MSAAGGRKTKSKNRSGRGGAVAGVVLDGARSHIVGHINKDSFIQPVKTPPTTDQTSIDQSTPAATQ